MTSILLCITAGRGPVECRHAVKGILQKLIEEAEQLGIEISAETTDGLAASVIVSLDGPQSESFVRSWEGTIQWIAKSDQRSSVARKNWFVAVKRLAAPQTIPALTDVRFETLRAGGPGGQHQNKTESAVRATHGPTGLSVVARDGRSQHRNKALALQRLQQLLAAITERQLNSQNAKSWLQKIEVERGKPVRIYEGLGFTRRRSG